MTKSIVRMTTSVAFAGVLAFGVVLPVMGAEPDKEALIRDALSAAPPEVAKTATVATMDGKVLRQGSGSYTCIATPSDAAENPCVLTKLG